MYLINPDIVVDTTGEICPIPLAEFRNAAVKLRSGEIIKIIGTHPSSKGEIKFAAEGMGLEVLKIEEDKDGLWQIFIKKPLIP